jgi:hypothetical protein
MADALPGGCKGDEATSFAYYWVRLGFSKAVLEALTSNQMLLMVLN